MKIAETDVVKSFEAICAICAASLYPQKQNKAHIQWIFMGSISKKCN